MNLYKDRFFIIFYALGAVQATQIQPTDTTTDEKALYYGFFFDEITATSINSITESYLTNCIENIPSFKEFLTTASKNANVSQIDQFYTKPLDPNTQKFDPYYHVTAKFCGNTNCTIYEKNISEFLGKTFEMHLIGYYFTNRTFGIRVKLTPDEEDLFDNNNKIGLLKSYSNSKAFQYNTYLPGLTFVDQELNFNPTTNKPHITIGCAPKISAEVTGTDLLEIINFEYQFSTTNFANYSLPTLYNNETIIINDTVIQYGEFWDAFVIYPAKKIVTTATFKAYYQPQSNNSSAASFNNYFTYKTLTLITLSVFTYNSM